eukprot:COSAG01_NODE_713_length_14097_cov_15.136448_12_plen_142_part_00
MSTLELEKVSVEIMTPKGVVLETDCEFLKLPSVNGELGVLPNHSPAVVQLDVGEIILNHNDKDQAYFFIVRGYVHILQHKTVIMTPFLEKLADIDLERAKEALDRANSFLQSEDESVDRERAQLARNRAAKRIHIVTHYRK